MEKIEIYCDGGARGNPGPAAAAFVVYVNGKKLYEQSKYLGQTTNNIAEYEAVLLALSWLTKSGLADDSPVTFLLDSELVVRQITGVYKVKNSNLQKLYQSVLRFLKNFSTPPIFKSVLRHHNKLADLLVNRELDKANSG